MPHLLLAIDHQYLSPWAMTVHVALREKGLPFDVRRLDLQAGDQHEAAYRQATLTGRVPALCVDDRFWLAESSAIVEYLDERFPDGPRLLPTALEDRARARQIQAWIRSDLLALRQARPTEVVFQGQRCAPLGDDARQAAERLVAVATQLLSHGADHLFGAWCIADVDLALMLQRLLQHGDVLPPALQAYAQRQWQRPSVAEWVQSARR